MVKKILLLANYNIESSGQDGSIEFFPSLEISCLPGPHKVPFPVEFIRLDFFEFNLESAPPGYLIDPVTGIITIPQTAIEGDVIVISYVDEDGNVYTTTISTFIEEVDTIEIDVVIPTISQWGVAILGLLFVILGLLTLKSLVSVSHMAEINH